jgi:hypothetical protein
MRERELGELPLAFFLDINLSHHEGIGNFVLTYCCLQINVLKEDGCVAKYASVNGVDYGLFVSDAPALDGCQFLGLSPCSSHVSEHGFVIEQCL